MIVKLRKRTCSFRCLQVLSVVFSQNVSVNIIILFLIVATLVVSWISQQHAWWYYTRILVLILKSVMLLVDATKTFQAIKAWWQDMAYQNQNSVGEVRSHTPQGSLSRKCTMDFERGDSSILSTLLNLYIISLLSVSITFLWSYHCTLLGDYLSTLHFLVDRVLNLSLIAYLLPLSYRSSSSHTIEFQGTSCTPQV